MLAEPPHVARTEAQGLDGVSGGTIVVLRGPDSQPVSRSVREEDIVKRQQYI